MEPFKKITPIEKDLIKEFQSLKATKPGNVKAAIQAKHNDQPKIPSRKPVIKLPIGESYDSFVRKRELVKYQS